MQVVGPFDLLNAGAQGLPRQFDPEVTLRIRRRLSKQDRVEGKSNQQEHGRSIQHGCCLLASQLLGVDEKEMKSRLSNAQYSFVGVMLSAG